VKAIERRIGQLEQVATPQVVSVVFEPSTDNQTEWRDYLAKRAAVEADPGQRLIVVCWEKPREPA
jgi:hypothetical protein